MVRNTQQRGASIQVWPYRQPTYPRNGWPHHRGLRPLLFSNGGVGSFTSHNNQISKKSCETGPTDFCPYPRRLESLDVDGKAALSPQLFLKRPRVLLRPGGGFAEMEQVCKLEMLRTFLAVARL